MSDHEAATLADVISIQVYAYCIVLGCAVIIHIRWSPNILERVN